MQAHARPSRPARPRSLRNRMLFWLAALHLVAIAATALLSYSVYGKLVNGFMDDQMKLLADSHANHHRPPPLQPVTLDQATRRGAFVVQLWSADGTTLLASSLDDLRIGFRGTPGFRDDDAWRVYTQPTGATEDALRVQIVQSSDFRHERIVRRALLEGLPLLLLLPVALLILWIIVSAASRSLRMAAQDVAAQDELGSAELPLARVPEEIAPLVAAFNSLLARLREALNVQHRFMQDAAHELRTPIAAIRLQLDNLRAHVPADDAAGRFAQLEAGVRRAQHLIEQLLRLSSPGAKASTGAASAEVDIAELLRESVGELMVLADRRQVDVGFEGRSRVMVAAPASELRSVFDNLIDNAVRHASVGGVVDVRLHAVGGHAVVDVVDDGPGIPPALLQRVFDRFYRVTGAPAGGSGLGLAIAQAAAARHAMRIELANRTDARGLIARVHLPG